MRNRILSHRGCWLTGLQKNSREALARSFASGFGIETDVRDLAQELVISHDPPAGGELTLKECLALADSRSSASPVLALNIKADGLAPAVRRHLDQHPGLDAFVFDMSVPDMRSYLALNIPVFTRISEVETIPAWSDRCQGLWLDAFTGDWYGPELVAHWLEAGKRVCVVSPELHGRPHEAVWAMLRPFAAHKGFLLCTDFPDKAVQFFGGDHEG